MKKALLILFTLAFVQAFAQKEAFVDLVKANVLSLSFDSGEFTGVGSERITEGIAASQFVLLGEQHGLAEVQEFAAWLYRSARQYGFDYMAVETDPFAAEHVEELAVEGADAAESFFKSFQMAIPFFYSQEGMEYARSVMHAGGGNPRLWGLDQVFVVAPRLIFSKLQDRATTEDARSIAKDYLYKAVAQFGSAMGSGNPGEVILMKMTPDDYSRLRDVFVGDLVAIDMIEQLELSQRIYQYWYDGKGYLNNSVRSDQMKKLFRLYYQDAVRKGQELPKVVFKFGSNHCTRGLTSTHVYDLGNMVSELAAMNATQSLHILLNGAKGVAFNALQGPQEFDQAAEWHPWLKEALTETLTERSVADWVVVDLRPIRQLRLKNADEEIKSLVYGFDLWVIIPEAHPVTPF